MKYHPIKPIAIAILLATSSPAHSDERPPDVLVPLGGQMSQRKKAPSKYPSLISYSYPEACLSTTMSYTYAVIEAADSDGNVYSSTMVTPEEPCGLISLEPSSTITVTFDNGASLQGSY